PIAPTWGAERPDRACQQAEVGEAHRQRLVSCVRAGEAQRPRNRGDERQHGGGPGGQKRPAQDAQRWPAGNKKGDSGAEASAGDHNRRARQDVGIACSGYKDDWQRQGEGRGKEAAEALEEVLHSTVLSRNLLPELDVILGTEVPTGTEANVEEVLAPPKQ